MGDDEQRRTATPERSGTPAAGAPASQADKGQVAPGARPGEPTKPRVAGATEVADFIARMKAVTPRTDAGRGRLVFAMDATMSRQPTWDLALKLQADMFEAVAEVGDLDVQLVYFRGHDECRASRWVGEPVALARLMTTVSCAGGYTQVGKVLSHARQETERRRVHALVYVGDAMEEEIDDICGRAGELALLGVPAFLFQEGQDERAARAFREVARLTKGAYCHFDAGSAEQLRTLLKAVAVYAAGGRKALEGFALGQDGRGARLLIEQMKR